MSRQDFPGADRKEIRVEMLAERLVDRIGEALGVDTGTCASPRFVRALNVALDILKDYERDEGWASRAKIIRKLQE